MRIEPVYVLAPKAQVRTMPTRRAFLMAGGALLVGTAVGGACGYSLGAQNSAGERGDSETERKSSGDALLDELRRLAVDAPVAELVERSMFYLGSLTDAYREDAILWAGVGRLADELVRNSSIERRRVIARFTAQIIAGAPTPFDKKLEEKRGPLLSIR
ncbi:MAG: hypothetical protein JNK49_12285 [Planctomycetes bacterium]|nr:hypothetical protein [Planctomycetota bacterium]